MPETIIAPSAFTRQVSGLDPAQNYILSVLTKRSYRYDERGLCARHEEPSPLREAFSYDDASGELLQESDIYPIKANTDVVLHGQAGSAATVRRLQCGLRIGGHEKRIAVIGNRAVSLAANGELVFSEPASFTAIALSYRNAYGGRDAAGHEAVGNPLSELTEYTRREFGLDHFSLCDYPRNPAGKGYLCHWDPASLETLELPNLEDPADLLTPSRFFAGKWDRWPAMPMPQGMGWLAHNWFPRISYLGFAPRHDPAYAATPEAARGLTPANLMTNRRATEPLNFRFMQGASLGLSLPQLRGDELIELANILPEPQTRIQLPGERPVIYVDGRNGKMAATTPVLHTVHIEPFFRRVSLVWRGAAPALRPYMEEELAAMPLSVKW